MSDFEDTLNKLLSDPAQMEKLMGVAKTLMQPQEDGDNGAAEPITAALAGIDPKVLGLIAKLMSAYSSGSDKDALLGAISPYIKNSKREQLTRAAELARLARLARLAMNEFGGV